MMTVNNSKKNKIIFKKRNSEFPIALKLNKSLADFKYIVYFKKKC